MPRRLLVIAAAVGAAVLANLILYGIGRAAGGTFRFTSPSGPAEVDGVTVAAFSALPLLAGLVAVALLSRFGAWVVRTALIAGPVLAVATIVAMTLPTDLDTTSKVTLTLCHLVLVPIIIVAVRVLGRREEVPSRSGAITRPA
ncbi:DUF6069 family protein [Actinoplanes auranticolor]|uniref:Uncharacterized protein n=1 Tax=Actinoplanes auranticolor TaxID=47988 RepID=A0A919VJA6_9ACTN|nr:DUF6069 family protein [Actinoplanes auranticolor]GIM64988.1 hypothetical protein Aau02nite_14020 [Actinoplanes auranticolor]